MKSNRLFLFFFNGLKVQGAFIIVLLFASIFLATETYAEVYGRDINARIEGKLHIEAKPNTNLCRNRAIFDVHISDEVELLPNRKNKLVYRKVQEIFSRLQKYCTPAQNRLFAMIYYQGQKYYQVTLKNAGQQDIYKEHWAVDEQQTIAAIKGRMAKAAIRERERKRLAKKTKQTPVKIPPEKATTKHVSGMEKVAARKRAANSSPSGNRLTEEVLMIGTVGILAFLALLVIFFYRKRSKDNSNKLSIEEIVTKYGHSEHDVEMPDINDIVSEWGTPDVENPEESPDKWGLVDDILSRSKSSLQGSQLFNKVGEAGELLDKAHRQEQISDEDYLKLMELIH